MVIGSLGVKQKQKQKQKNKNKKKTKLRVKCPFKIYVIYRYHGNGSDNIFSAKYAKFYPGTLKCILWKITF